MRPVATWWERQKDQKFLNLCFATGWPSRKRRESRKRRVAPDCLVQRPNSQTAPKSIGEGASGLFEGWPGNPENVSCSRATPRLHRCKSGVALEQETFSGLQGHPPKRLLAPSPIDLGAVWEFGGCTKQSGATKSRAHDRGLEGTLRDTFC